MLLMLTASIGLPIYVRGFYFLHVKPLDIVNQSGFDLQTITDGFNDLMDYLTLSKPFSIGAIPYSAEGQSHFQDCKVLFDLNAWVMLSSAVVLAIILIVCKVKKIKPHRFGDHSPAFFAGVTLLSTFVLIAAIGSIDFDATFEAFHKIFFPGKTNWVFNPRTDPVINILPEEFFRNCAILIVSSIIVLCVTCIICDAVQRSKNRKNITKS